ncbi:MFS transporter [Heliophilum fasciatum]|uniref:Multidrug resistance protein n=1 Tax=Heliophilum fasciatum TaxID=35700 RepID=A0A4R2S028_9FIRM|nr:MFS transporter [Heliophilum fasciatum]MCW2276967.1 multidrug resistance protein [Heliophilum fasciatum]TCP68507.1 multidrug resistance protein [Heliophilum fasciatum]
MKGKWPWRERWAMATLFVTLFLVMVGFGILLPIMPYFVLKLNGDAVAFGFFTASYSIMQFFFAPIWGRLSDRLGRRPLLLMGLGGYGISFILFGLSTELWMLFVVRSFSGMISSATLPTAMAYAADCTPPERRAGAMGMLGAAMGLGMILGPALGGWLGGYSFALPFFVSGALALITVPFAFWLLPESLPEGAAIQEPQRWHNVLRIGRHRQFTLFLLSFAVSFTMALFEGTFAIFAFERFAFATQHLGMMFAGLGTLGVIVQAGLVNRLARRFGCVRLVAAGLAMAMTGLALMAVVPTLPAMVAMTALYSAGAALLRPNISTLVSQTSDDGQGASLGWMQSFDSLGRAAGPMAGGILYEVAAALPYWTGALALLLILVLSWKQLQRYQQVGDAL